MHAWMLSRFSHVRLCATLWTAALQAPLSTGFSRQEYWSGLPFPSPTEPSRHPIKLALLKVKRMSLIVHYSCSIHIFKSLKQRRQAVSQEAGLMSSRETWSHPKTDTGQQESPIPGDGQPKVYRENSTIRQGLGREGTFKVPSK